MQQDCESAKWRRPKSWMRETLLIQGHSPQIKHVGTQYLAPWLQHTARMSLGSLGKSWPKLSAVSTHGELPAMEIALPDKIYDRTVYRCWSTSSEILCSWRGEGKIRQPSDCISLFPGDNFWAAIGKTQTNSRSLSELKRLRSERRDLDLQGRILINKIYV